MAQGKFKEASACFARALELVPELAENFADTLATLLKVNPALGEAVARAAAAWPRLAPADELLGAPGLAAIADDPMLLGVLKTTPVRDPALEWFLTSVRAAVLKRAADAPDDADEIVLGFCCALARQCFNNEYVFAESSDELDLLERQTQGCWSTLLRTTPRSRRCGSPRWPAIVRCRRCPIRAGFWTAPGRMPLDDLLTQQIREVEEERQVARRHPASDRDRRRGRRRRAPAIRRKPLSALGCGAFAARADDGR